MQGLLLDTTAIASIALIGYMFGRRVGSRAGQVKSDLAAEFDHAVDIADELQRVVGGLRREIARHQGDVASFRKRVRALPGAGDSAAWRALGEQAERLLAPTLRLASLLSTAYDDVRKQSAQLMAFADTRFDASTGVYNRRAMDEQLAVLMSQNPALPGQHFCVAVISATAHGEEADEGDESALAKLARLLKSCARDTDFVARYSGDELAVLMPRTSLSGATVFCERVLRRTQEELGLSVWLGTASAQPGDEAGEKLLSRAESSLYSARTVPEACIFKHDGKVIRRHAATAANAVPQSVFESDPADSATTA
ncbi:MAG: GGDEF domain-containing protein [Pirellulales bacterium]|nr:GGDEF domain-containing protein [Pirellulales bacterium]